jgi:hypothetical protein
MMGNGKRSRQKTEDSIKLVEGTVLLVFNEVSRQENVTQIDKSTNKKEEEFYCTI